MTDDLTQLEWLRRYCDRLMAVADLTPAQAMEVARATPFEELVEGYEDDPEAAADMEMSYWTD